MDGIQVSHPPLSSFYPSAAAAPGRSGRLIALLAAAALAAIAAWPAAAADPGAPRASTVVFVCEHGSVKSVIAAAHFNRIARERGLPFVAVSRGIALDKEIPASIRAGLVRDGVVPGEETPRDLSADEAAAAAGVYAFNPVPQERDGGAAVTYWSDVPPATKDYEAARDAIVRHVEAAIAALRATR
jgi:protein-tyrosine-phosphatase